MSKEIISPATKIGKLLEDYPELEELLVGLVPKFAALKNPILRKTVAKITSLQQAAEVGEVSLDKLLNALRKEAGQEELEEMEKSDDEPQNVVKEYDAREDLSNGIHPVAQVMKETESLTTGEFYNLIVPFKPVPLIDKMIEKGFTAHIVEKGLNEFNIYFGKQ